MSLRSINRVKTELSQIWETYYEGIIDLNSSVNELNL
jgi:hypothetical protein